MHTIRGADSARWLSKSAVLWALHDAPDVPPRLVSTLIAVAAYAGADGRGSYPSGATVAMLTRKSESQAKRDMAELEKLGLLQPGDERIVKDIRADRRPKVYDLPLDMARGASGRPPSHRPRGASGHRTGRKWEQNGGRPDAPEEVPKTSGRRAPRARAKGADASAQPQTPLLPPPCGFCESRLSREVFDALDADWKQMALDGDMECENPECPGAHCIGCGAQLDGDEDGYHCRACTEVA
jgi:hypothetical protein